MMNAAIKAEGKALYDSPYKLGNMDMSDDIEHISEEEALKFIRAESLETAQWKI
jgi:hypothetical protein